jgi:ribonuclease J
MKGIVMKIIIHRGTNQIGGCITEIISEAGTRIIIDIGSNLPNAEGKKSKEIELQGLTKGKAKYDAIFITHYHGDHIGLYNKILHQIPIYIGETTKEIFKLLQNKLYKIDLVEKKDLEKINSFNTFKIPGKIQIKDITITPIAVDHSAFDAYMFLIECDGKKLLHTGDFRTHGQRGNAVIRALTKYVGKVNCLICEGTTLSREKEPVLSEVQLQQKAEKIFKSNKFNFVLCSSTNIDRIAALHKAAIKSNKMFICDKYQKSVLDYIDSISRSSLYKFDSSRDTKVYYY